MPTHDAVLVDTSAWIEYLRGTLFRAVRASGETVRTLLDCLIAAVAIRTGAVLVHRDRDFDALARVATDLRVVSRT